MKAKRILALLLTLALAVGTVTSAAAAGEEPPQGGDGNVVGYTTDSQGNVTGTVEMGEDGHRYEIRTDSDGRRILGNCFLEGDSEISVPASLNVEAVGDGFLYGASELVSITLPDGIREIGYDFLDSCSNLVSVTLPDSVERIGSFFLERCEKLTSVKLPAELRYLGEYAFRRSGITEISFPSKLTHVGYGTLDGCDALKRIDVYGNIIHDSDDFSLRSSSVETLVYHEGVTEVGRVYDMTSLTRVELPGSLEVINAFCSNCPKLESIVIPEGVRFISSSFSRCPALKSAVIPSSAEVLFGSCFSSCPALTDLTLPDSVIILNQNATFIDSPAGKGIYSGELVEVDGVGYAVSRGMLSGIRVPGGRPGDVVIPASLGIKAIKDAAFSGVTSMVIPDGVLYVDGPDSSATLESVTFPDSVKYIDGFKNCRLLDNISLPENVTLGTFAFNDCSGVTVASIPNSVRISLDCAESFFAGSPYVESSDVEFITAGNVLLKYNGHSAEVRLPDYVTMICPGAFQGHPEVKKLVFSDKVVQLETERKGEPLLVGSMGYWNAEKVSTRMFLGCNAVEIDYPYTLPENMERSLEIYSLWVNPADFLAPQSERITALAEKIVADAGAKTDYEKVRAVVWWITHNIKYDYEKYYNGDMGNVAYAPEAVLDAGMTVCAGYSRLASALVQSLGIPCMYEAGDVPSSVDGHAWNEAFVDGSWIIFDATWATPYDFSHNMEDISEETFLEAFDNYFDCGYSYMAADHYPYRENGRSDGTLVKVTSRPVASAEDTPADWAQEEVLDALGHRLVPDVLQGKYAQAITREEFCRLVIALVEGRTGMDAGEYIKSLGKSLPAAFSDTDAPHVLQAAALGIVTGRSAEVFDPDSTISRQEAALMLARCARLFGIPGGEAMSFRDIGSAWEMAREDIGYVSSLKSSAGRGVMQGGANGCFDPTATITRQQAILTVDRLFATK